MFAAKNASHWHPIFALLSLQFHFYGHARYGHRFNASNAFFFNKLKLSFNIGKYQIIWKSFQQNMLANGEKVSPPQGWRKVDLPMLSHTMYNSSCSSISLCDKLIELTIPDKVTNDLIFTPNPQVLLNDLE